LLDLRGHHGVLNEILVAYRAVRAQAAAYVDGTAQGDLGTDDLALADQAGGELGGAANAGVSVTSKTRAIALTMQAAPG
jgi:hypothetical protein